MIGFALSFATTLRAFRTLSLAFVYAKTQGTFVTVFPLLALAIFFASVLSIAFTPVASSRRALPFATACSAIFALRYTLIDPEGQGAFIAIFSLRALFILLARILDVALTPIASTRRTLFFSTARFPIRFFGYALVHSNRQNTFVAVLSITAITVFFTRIFFCANPGVTTAR